MGAWGASLMPALPSPLPSPGVPMSDNLLNWKGWYPADTVEKVAQPRFATGKPYRASARLLPGKGKPIHPAVCCCLRRGQVSQPSAWAIEDVSHASRSCRRLIAAWLAAPGGSLSRCPVSGPGHASEDVA